jgi:hypothetical protein
MMRLGLFVLALFFGIVVDLTPSRQLVIFDQASSARFEVSCSQSAAFLTRTSGFTFLQKVQYDAAICHLVSTGTLQKLDALYRLAAPNQTASLINLAQDKYNITISGGCLYGPEAGWMGDAATCYADTGFNPSTAGGNYALGSSSMGVGITDPRQSLEAWATMGAASSRVSTFDLLQPLRAAPTNSSAGNLQSRTGAPTTLPTTANGGWVINRVGDTSSGTQTLYLNGVSVAAQTGATSSQLPSANILLFAFGCTACGSPFVFDFSGDTLSWASIGGALNSTDIAAVTTAMAMFTTSPAPVAALARGFNSNVFNYDFATQGLSGIDINATLKPGFAFYTAWWNGAQSAAYANQLAPPSSIYGFSGGLVTVGTATHTGWLSTVGNKGSAFSGTIAGTTLTVNSVLYGAVAEGQTLVGSAALSGQTIVSQLTGTPGGVGTYQISGSATIGTSANIIANANTGTTFAPGGYYEASMGWNPAHTTGNNGFPSFWLYDINGFNSGNLNTGYGAAAHWGEIDIVEGLNGPYAADMNIYDWTNVNGGATGCGQGNMGHCNRVNETYPPVTNQTSQHLYGMLWVPSTKNAGTGLIQFYLDRVHIAGQDVTYTSRGTPTPACSPSDPAGCLFILESGRFVMLIDSGGGGGTAYPVTLANVNVWQ